MSHHNSYAHDLLDRLDGPFMELTPDPPEVAEAVAKTARLKALKSALKSVDAQLELVAHVTVIPYVLETDTDRWIGEQLEAGRVIVRRGATMTSHDPANLLRVLDDPDVDAAMLAATAIARRGE